MTVSEQIKTLNNNEEVLTPLQKFYSGANVFITGGTGFLGMILIEKILRSCPDVSTLYLLVRNKKGRDTHTRIEELLDHPLFDRLKVERPKARYKIVGVFGDCGLPDLGLTMQDRQLLIQEVSIVFHIAATVRFDEHLKLAMAINVKGTKEIISLCKEMKNLKAVMHISTAYANCNVSTIEEIFYPPPMDSEKLISLTDTMNDQLLEKITPMLLDKWPNTYAYTKAVAEDVVRREGRGLPLGVCRPAIVVSTYKEPVKGWISNLYGPTGVAAACATGLMRTLHCEESLIANIVPVDMCINSLIASAWEVAEDHQKSSKEKADFDIPIYHFESSNDQPITWKYYMASTSKYGLLYPSSKAIWYYYMTLQPTIIGYTLAVFFLHTVPAVLSDLVLFCIGKPPRLLKISKKIHRFSGVISYFCTRHWTFKSERARKLCSRLSKEDKAIFFSDLRELDWDKFFKEYMKGIRVYLIDDPLSTMEQARVRWNRLYWVHQCVRMLLMYLLFRVIWALFFSFF